MMRNALICGVILALITACAPVTEAPAVLEEPSVLVEAAPVARCPDGDDGIGGTGCAVD